MADGISGVVSSKTPFGLADFQAPARIRSLWAAMAHSAGDAASAVVVPILLFTRRLGGALALRHRIGVAADSAVPYPAKALER
jgi:hypothetical protein